MADNIFDLLDEVNRRMDMFVSDMQTVSPKEVGLDDRCGQLHINEDCIITTKFYNSRLQYYGGFEYIHENDRREIGDYVIYFGENDRVRGHLDRYYNKEDSDG